MSACPICGTAGGAPIPFDTDPLADRLRAELGDARPYGWRLCERCGNGYPSAQPDLRVLARLWEVNRTDEGDAPETAAARWDYRRRVSRLGGERSWKMFSPLTENPGRMLDVACGLGETVRSFAERGWDAEGIDADPSTAVHHREIGVRVRIGQFETLDVPPGIDLVHVSHAIYFITDPMGFLRKARALLAPRGLVCIVLADFMSAVDPSLPGYAHSFFPTARSMHHTLALAGFRTELVRTYRGSIYLAARPGAETPPEIDVTRILRLYRTKALRYRLLGRPNLAARRVAKAALGPLLRLRAGR
jgi:SAM-dependent methyltransferase